MLKINLKKFIFFIAIEFVILVTSLLCYNEINIIHYINISFYFSAALLLCALFIYTVRTGFYDVAVKSFTISFSRDHDKKKMSDITPLSKLISLSTKPLFFNGILVGICMLIALFIYYV